MQTTAQQHQDYIQDGAVRMKALDAALAALPGWERHAAVMRARSVHYQRQQIKELRRTASLNQTDRRFISKVECERKLPTGIILSRCADKPVVEARAWVITEFHRRGWSLSRIARALGIHHTTVLYHLRKRGSRVDQPKPRLLTHYDPNKPDESGIWAI